MAWRIRARLRFTPASGLAVWAHAQNDQRLGMAFHLHPGAPNEEPSHHTVDGGTYLADLIFPNDRYDLAADTFNTLTAPSVIDPAFLEPVAAPGDVSWVDVHRCWNGEWPAQPCEAPVLAWSNREAGDGP